jgi:putative phosphoesterase
MGSSIRINVQKESQVIGIMSDSHDNCDAVRRAVRFFKDKKCELVIHAGDFVAPFAARELEHILCPVKAVFGNCDGEKRGLEETIQPFGEIKNAPLVFSHQDRTILITHIHVSVDKYAASRKYEIIVFGHTHKPEIREAHGTLLINPGETGGWLSGKSSVGLMDLSTWEAEIVFL